MIETRSKKWLRAVSFFVALSLLNFQALQSFPSFFLSQGLLYASEATGVPNVDLNQNQIPTVPVVPQSSSENPSAQNISSTPQSDSDFLINSSALSVSASEDVSVESDSQVSNVENKSEIATEVNTVTEASVKNSYVTELYENASDGIHELQHGTAVAYLAKNLTAADLRALRQYQDEVGFLVAGDLIVVFSTGDEELIRSLAPVKALTESSLVTLSAHFHKDGPPSAIDLTPDSGLQYVISISNLGEEVVWVHDGATILGTISYDEFIQRVNDSQTNNQVNETKVRQVLNDYIVAIDKYQQEQAQAVSNALIIADPVLFANTTGAVLPSPPLVRNFEAFPALQNNSFTPISFEEVDWNYDVMQAGSWAALNLQWDNPVDLRSIMDLFQLNLLWEVW